MTNTHEHDTLDSIIACDLEPCATLLDVGAPRYWVLLPGGYPDTPNDYVAASSQREALDMLREAAPHTLYPEQAALHVFHASRAPWLEHDPYPDYVATIGARGGAKLERA